MLEEVGEPKRELSDTIEIEVYTLFELLELNLPVCGEFHNSDSSSSFDDQCR